MEDEVVPGTIFISHRTEYADIVRQLKQVIEANSEEKISVFISEDMPRGDLKGWRAELERNLRKAEHLFLIYGAAYEDWSWCFYETGYFHAQAARQEAEADAQKGQPAGKKLERKIYCIKRADVAAPGPLSHVQAVDNVDALIKAVKEIYKRNGVQGAAAQLRKDIEGIGQSLFSKIADVRAYPRICINIKNTDFGEGEDIPENALLEGDPQIISELFDFAEPPVEWKNLVKSGKRLRDASEKLAFNKWLKETAEVIREGRENRVKSPQAVLVARRGGKRYRSLLYLMRRQGNNVSSYEFLAVGEVGGPTLGLPGSLLSVLTGIRMAFRFRYEIIDKFKNVDWKRLSAAERGDKAREIQTVMQNALDEYDSRSDPNVNEPNFYDAFPPPEAERLKELSAAWGPISSELTEAFAIFTGSEVSKDALAGGIGRFRNALKALDLLNQEFLARCCRLVADERSMSADQLKANADAISRLVDGMRPLPDAAE